MRPIWLIPARFRRALKSQNGTFLVYLNAGPKSGGERISDWPSSANGIPRRRGGSLGARSANASGLTFRGGRGSCVIDDYITHVKAHHYREIACFVQGRATASVIVAAALASAWPKYAPELERAVEAWQVD